MTDAARILLGEFGTDEIRAMPIIEEDRNLLDGGEAAVYRNR
jgi:hypothetical protein